MAYTAALPDTSLYHAFLRGGWEHFGWGQDRHLMADVFDAITQNTEIHVENSLSRWPRPMFKQDQPEKKKGRTVKELFAEVQKMRR